MHLCAANAWCTMMYMYDISVLHEDGLKMNITGSHYDSSLRVVCTEFDSFTIISLQP